MTNETKNNILTPKEKLIQKIKESAYSFNKNEFRKFQDFFSKEFSNIDLENLKKQAWRIR
jgi:hypothetical protein